MPNRVITLDVLDSYNSERIWPSVLLAAHLQGFVEPEDNLVAFGSNEYSAGFKFNANMFVEVKGKKIILVSNRKRLDADKFAAIEMPEGCFSYDNDDVIDGELIRSRFVYQLTKECEKTPMFRQIMLLARALNTMKLFAQSL